MTTRHAPQWNWAGNQLSRPDRLVRPESIPDLREVLRTIESGRTTPVRIQGALHSWTPLATQDGGVALDLGRLAVPATVDRAAGSVAVPGAMRLGSLYSLLADHDLALQAVPMVTTSTVAGTMATDSHGWDRQDGHFNRQVSAVDLVDGRGRDVRVDAAGCWDVSGGGAKLLLGGPDPLRMAQHHRGLLGAIYRVHLRCQPTFDLELVETLLGPTAGAAADRAALHDAFEEGEHTSAIWFVTQDGMLLRRADRTTMPRIPRGFLARVVVDGGIRTELASQVLMATRHHPLAASAFGRIAARSFPRRRVLRDRWDRILTYLPAHATRAVGLRLMEYEVPFEGMRRAMALVEAGLADFPLSMPVGVRRTGSGVCFEVMWQRDYPGAEAIARRIESHLVAAFGADARPHEGKLHWVNPWPRMDPRECDLFERLRCMLDPSDVFLTPYLRRRLAGKDPE